MHKTAKTHAQKSHMKPNNILNYPTRHYFFEKFWVLLSVGFKQGVLRGVMKTSVKMDVDSVENLSGRRRPVENLSLVEIFYWSTVDGRRFRPDVFITPVLR